MLNRRIGRNELAAIQVCSGLCGGTTRVCEHGPEQGRIHPVCPEVWERHIQTQRALLGASRRRGSQSPRPISQQGCWQKGTGGLPTSQRLIMDTTIRSSKGRKSAPGGVFSYVINGHMVAGFALVAGLQSTEFPGVMTFVVNQNGTVYQKDLVQKRKGS